MSWRRALVSIIPEHRWVSTLSLALARGGAVVFMLHRVLPRETVTYDNELVTSTDLFEALVNWLAAEFEIVSLEEISERIEKRKSLKRACALTFDDGPNPNYTPQVLATLEQYHVKATFFCVGRLVAQYPDLVKAEYADGHVIGNHSWSHPNLGLLSSNEVATQLRRTSDIIQQTLGVRPTFFRPPYGVFNATVLTQANLMGLTTIIWNDEARDWLRPGIDVISSRILGLAGNGAIILLHDGGGNRYQTVKALPTIIMTLRAEGYNFVTLQQMVNDLPKHPAASQMPSCASASWYPLLDCFAPRPEKIATHLVKVSVVWLVTWPLNRVYVAWMDGRRGVKINA